MKTEHTKGKWYATGQSVFSSEDIEQTLARCYAYPPFPENIKEAEANAEIICHAVNAYPELIQTLKDLQEVLIEAKLTIHAKGIEELLKKYE